MIKYLLLMLCFVTLGSKALAQNWDNVLYASNKVAWGSESWRQYGEFQSRFRNDFGTLEQWHLEYAAGYLASENWEIVPDMRFTRKPIGTEYRPGFGVIYKNLFESSQLVHQVKWQADFESNGYASQGLRYGLFYNKRFNDRILGSALAGGLFEFGKDFSGFLGLRAGASLAYIINEAHSVNAGYFYGLLNDGTNNYNHIGIVSLQLIINIQTKYNYIPAKYINF